MGLLCPQAVELTAFKASGTAPTPQVGCPPFSLGARTVPQPHCVEMEVI